MNTSKDTPMTTKESEVDVSRQQFEEAMRSVWWGDSFHAERHPKAPDEYLKAPEQMAWIGWRAARTHPSYVGLLVTSNTARQHLDDMADAGFGDRLHANALRTALRNAGVKS